VPFGFWLQDWLMLEPQSVRPHRALHAGPVPALAAREILLRGGYVNAGAWPPSSLSAWRSP